MYRSFQQQILCCLLFSILFSVGCGKMLYQPTTPEPARLGEETASSMELKMLPDPNEKIVVAVYKFRDQTGQYKPSDIGANWSTAVTQGGTSILLKALEDSGWFIPIERENVGNLLNERKIIRSSRAQYATQEDNNSNNLLPPLLYAGVILEGGIVSYDANVITGGAGLRYFGVGGSSQYRQDRVTVYLRAISTSNGKILKTVYTTKTILSQALDGGLFQFVQFRRLLEAETGFTYNEPAELAVRDAIEKAVLSMIIEGIDDRLWSMKDSSDEDNEILQSYKEERNQADQSDLFGNTLMDRRKSMALRLATSSLLYQGDFPAAKWQTGGEIGLSYTPMTNLSLNFTYGISRFSTDFEFYDTNVSYIETGVDYRFLPYRNFTPYVTLGLGLVGQTSSGIAFDNIYPKTQIGAGLEYLVTDNVGIRLGVDYHFLFSDGIDDVEQGEFNDFYWRGNIGVNFYFGKPVTGIRRFTDQVTGDPLDEDGF